MTKQDRKEKAELNKRQDIEKIHADYRLEMQQNAASMNDQDLLIAFSQYNSVFDYLNKQAEAHVEILKTIDEELKKRNIQTAFPKYEIKRKNEGMSS